MEMFDELDNKGWFTGRVVSREEAHENGLWHRAGLIFVVNSKSQVLMQKRSNNKKQWPGRWDGTAGGHADAGELGLFAIIRELKEEVGIEVSPSDVRYIGGYLSSHRKSEKMWDCHFNEFYVAHKDVDIASIKIDKNEVDQVMWIDFDKFKKWTTSRSPELTEKWEAFDALVQYMEQK